MVQYTLPLLVRGKLVFWGRGWRLGLLAFSSHDSVVPPPFTVVRSPFRSSNYLYISNKNWNGLSFQVSRMAGMFICFIDHTCHPPKGKPILLIYSTWNWVLVNWSCLTILWEEKRPLSVLKWIARFLNCHGQGSFKFLFFQTLSYLSLSPVHIFILLLYSRHRINFGYHINFDSYDHVLLYISNYQRYISACARALTNNVD